YKNKDIDTLVDIWYKASLQAHDFIDSGYWKSQIEEMKEKYIPMSETHVITNQTRIVGFILMIDDYIEWLLIDVTYKNKGAVKELLNCKKSQRRVSQIIVYK